MTHSTGDAASMTGVLDELAELRAALTGRVDATDTQVSQLQASVTELAEHVAELQHAGDEEGPAPPVAPCWIDLDPDQTAAAWRELAGWVDNVLAVRYPHTVQAVPPCWPAHPAVVEELSWLHQAWAAAFRHPDRRLRQAADFHDRDLPGVLARVREQTTDCRGLAGVVLTHQRPESRTETTDPKHLDDARRADVAAAWGRKKQEDQA